MNCVFSVAYTRVTRLSKIRYVGLSIPYSFFFFCVNRCFLITTPAQMLTLFRCVRQERISIWGSVRPSVRRSVRWSVRRSVTRFSAVFGRGDILHWNKCSTNMFWVFSPVCLSICPSTHMKVGQHYYSTLYKGQEPLELLMVFNPDPSQLSLKYLKETSLFRIYHKTFQKICII